MPTPKHQAPIPLAKTSNTTKKWQCRWASKHDQDAFLSLFETAFGHAMPSNMWTWKYGHQNNYGVFAHTDNNIIAYYGGLPRQFCLNSKTLSAVQICDVMVAPNMRGILTRKGPFMHTADTFLTTQIGSNKIFHFAFGFPTERAARLGEKSSWYARADAFLEASWSAKNTLPPWFKIRPLAADNTETVEILWQAMRASLPNHLLPIKDSAFFKWRYQDHPERHYPSYVVSWRGTNKIVGIVTLRDHGANLGMEIMDLLAPASRLETLHIAAQKICVRAGRTRLFSWMTPTILSSLPKPDQHTEVAGVYVTPEYQQMIEQKHVNCWLMSGDTDFR